MLNAEVIVNIEGFDTEVDEIINNIDSKDILPIATSVRDKARNTSAFIDRKGKLRKSIGMRKSKFEDGGYIVFAKDPKAHLVEYGHVKFIAGKPTGERVPAHSFLRKALEETIGEIGDGE